jgi:recombination protein RecA
MEFEALKGLKDIKMFSEINKPVGFFDTGLAGLNYIVSGSVSNGFPYGRMIELYGRESSGKSTIGYAAISQAQKEKSIPYLLDTEGAFDISQAERCGVDTDALLYDEPKNIDELFKKVYVVLNEVYNVKQSKTPMLVVWDSVAASSLLEDEKSFDSNAIAQLARKISPHVNKIMPLVINNPVTFLCINQIRMNLSGFRVTEDTPGGKTIKFYSSVRLEIKKKSDWKSKDGKVIGIVSALRCVKNKIARPFLSTAVNIGYECGVEPVSSLFDLGVMCGAVVQNGAYYKWGEMNEHKIDYLEMLNSDAEFKKSFEKSVDEHLESVGGVPEAEND